MLPTTAAHHQTVPVAKMPTVSARTDVRRRSPPSIHQARPTPRAPSPMAIASWSVASPHAATNGRSRIAGSGGKGSRTRPSGVPSGSTSGYTSCRYQFSGRSPPASTGYGNQARP